MNKSPNLILIAILSIAIMVGIFLGWQRVMIEKSNNTLQIVMSYQDLSKLANANELSLETTLFRFKESGITSIALSEDTIEDLRENGSLQFASGEQIKQGFFPLEKKSTLAKLLDKGEIKSSHTYLLVKNPEDLTNLYNFLAANLGDENVSIFGGGIDINLSLSEMRELGLEINSQLYSFFITKGINVIPRLKNNPLLTEKGIKTKIDALALNKNIPAVIFEEKEVLGYPDKIPAAAKALIYNKISYGKIEILKQEGDISFASKMGDLVTQVHSLDKKEAKKITPAEALDRYNRAPKERNVRILFFNPFYNVKENPLDYNLAYLKSLKTSLEKQGFTIAAPNSHFYLRPNLLEIIVLGLGIISGGIILISLFTDISIGFMVSTLLIAGVLTFGIGYAGGELLICKLYALLAAIIFPTYAIVSQFIKPLPGTGSLISKTLKIFGNMLFDTALGIILIIGLLADSRLMSGGTLFSGIKIALAGPIVLTAGLLILKEYNNDIIDAAKGVFNLPIKAGHLILIFLGLGIFAILLLRSGNFGMPVFDIERNLRLTLAQAFFVRPRFKEFLIGYPLLIWAILYFLQGKKKYLWLLGAAGSIGLSSLLNTFCHIHVPVLISILRSINGIVLGLLFGALLYWLIFKRVEKIMG